MDSIMKKGTKSGKFIKCKICNKEKYYYNSAIKRKKTDIFFCSEKCHGLWMKVSQLGNKNPCWNGGRRKRNGYVQILCPGHPFADNSGYIFQHRIVVEKKLGRTLKKEEVIHHVNGNILDNRSENLRICKNHSEHLEKYHKTRHKRRAIPNPLP